ncbi:hypothetical protein BDP27DRAFT_1418879 [Rhodocollybia butyracea]|uniref:BTB domain-containing protein n=1 Tax=Rhodocollybia butyracea TaxID=206335 RepID=A0A9P5UAX2_9AGAR|nr:hypothetical protein BDP27DRAFT_1418879 [Rhodocollybia butyracea]
MSSLRWGKLLPIQRTYSRPNASKRMSYSSDNFDTDTLSEPQSFLEGKVSNSNENEKPSTSTKKRSDGLYFDDDAGVVFQVETTLYRVPPSDLIKVSPVFRDMFKMSSASESRNDDNPIFLKSISRIDWERLLKVILHKSFLDPPFRFEMEEWISVLKLSTLWRMGVVRAIAIEKIEQLDDPARRIQLAREYGISSYYLPALVRLVIRVNPLSAQDFKYLGCECAVPGLRMCPQHCLHSGKG